MKVDSNKPNVYCYQEIENPGERDIEAAAADALGDLGQPVDEGVSFKACVITGTSCALFAFSTFAILSLYVWAVADHHR